MKKIFALLFAVVFCTGAFAQTPDGDDARPAAPKMPDSATMMQNWATYMTPGAMHKLMAKWDGKWAAEITLWTAPGAPPIKSTGTTVNKMIMSGLYQEAVHASKMMGMPFSGKGTLGFDNLRKVFVSSWIDNMGSGIMYLEGAMDETGKTILFTGKTLDPTLGIMVNVRETVRIVDDNTQVMEMYTTAYGGTETKTMEIKFTRVKG